MNVMPFIPKEDDALPDSYGIKLYYLDGKSEEFEIASHHLANAQLEFVTKDDIWNWVPMSGIKRMEFDKRFSKIVAIRNKQLAEKK